MDPSETRSLMTRVKVLGAGSIGNHLSHAARQLGWEVHLCDIDPAALERTRALIFPERYGSWDEAIQLHLAEQAPKGGFDMIFIGTPPDSHMDLALTALEEKPRAMLIEKPLCRPDLAGADALLNQAASLGIACFVGYDHVVGAAGVRAAELIGQGIVGETTTLDVEVREHWGGIFAAHPWLDGPADTYLGFWQRGGGACSEHSHGINMWQHFAGALGAGRVVEVTASLDYVTNDALDYDRLCLANFRTESGLMGRLVQDVVTRPPRKRARLQGTNGFIEWHCGYQPGADAVVWSHTAAGDVREELYPKTRADDFILELRHITAALDAEADPSPISLARGIDTMLVIAAAHRSSREKRTVRIDYAGRYTLAALSSCAEV